MRPHARIRWWVCVRVTCSSAQVEHFGSRPHVNVIDALQDSGGDFGSEWIPHTVFNLGARSAILVRRSFHLYVGVCVCVWVG